MNVVYNLLDNLLVFELPAFPASFQDVYDTAIGYLETGFQILTSFLGSTTMSYLSVLFGLIIAMNGMYALYSFIMWVLEKIPFIDIDR